MTPGNALPDGWRTVRFDRFAENIAERVDPAEADEDYYVGLEHLDPESLKIRRWGTPDDVKGAKLRFSKGDIIFGRRRFYQRKVAVAEFDGICSAHAMVLRARKGMMLQGFFPFFLQSETFYQRAMQISVGSLSPTINWRTLARQEFAIPPLDEQRRIADILWAAYRVVEYWQSVSARLKQLKDTVSFTLFKESTDVKWVKCTRLCEYITVGIVIKPAELYVPSGVPALRSLNVLPDEFVLDELVHISEEAHRDHSKSQLLAGDVVIVRSGRPGDAAVIPPSLNDANCIDLIIARPGSQIRSGYLSRFLNSAVGQKQIEMASAGTAQKHVNVGALKKIDIPILPLEEQDYIVEKLAAIEDLEKSITQHAESSQVLKVSLVEQLIGTQTI